MKKIIIYKGKMFASEELMPKTIVLMPFVVEGFEDGITYLRSGDYRYFSREEQPSAEVMFGAEHQHL